MLTIKAKIIFFSPEESSSTSDGICAKNILRPAFNFGEELLFSGTIISDNENEQYLYKSTYVVNVKFPTIDNEAYEAIQPLIKIGMDLAIQNASRIIGESKLLDYTYRD